MTSRLLSVIVAWVLAGILRADGAVQIQAQEGGGWKIATSHYTAAVGADGYLKSVKAGEVEMLKVSKQYDTPVFIAATRPKERGLLSEAVKVLKMETVELDIEKKTIAAKAGNITLTYEFRDEDIFVYPKDPADKRPPLLIFPSADILESLAGQTDFSLSLTKGSRGIQQEGMRWVTGQGVVFRFEEDVLRGSNNGYPSFFWWADAKRTEQAVSMDVMAWHSEFTIRPMARPDAGQALQFTIASENPSFLQSGGKPVVFDIQAINWAGSETKASVDFEVRDYLTKMVVGRSTTELVLKEGREKSAGAGTVGAIKTDVPVKEPGFYRAALVVREGEKVLREANWNFVYDFANYHPADTRQPDFKEFWSKALAEVRAIPMDVQMTLHPEHGNEFEECYAVSIATLEGRRSWFWYFKPKAEGKYPVIMQVPPTGTRIGTDGGPGKGKNCRLVFTVHTLGLTQEEVNNGPERWKNYLRDGLELPETACWRTIYASMVRAMDFLAERPEVDAKRILVTGSSQGGGLAVVLAGLDERVAACAPSFGGLSRLDWTVKYEVGYWPFTMETGKPKDQTEEQFLKTLSYFDASNFAADIKCPVVVLIGLLDPVTCSGGTICSMAHLKPGQVELINDPWAGHGGGDTKIVQVKDAATKRFLEGKPFIGKASK